MSQIFFLFILLSFGSCTMHPRYERPDMALPSEWRIPTEELKEFSNLLWWKELGDPVLDDYIAEALENNQDLMVAIHRVDQFAAQLGIAESQLYPQISANAGGGREKISTNQEPFQVGTPSTFNAYALLLNGSYYLDIWGKIRSSTQQAKAQLLSQIETRRAVVLTLITSVAATYITILQLDAQIQVAKETLDSRQESYKLAYIRFDLGLTSELQVQQAKSELEAAEVSLNNLKISLALAEDRLATLLGKAPGPVKRGKLISEIKTPPAIPVAIPSELLNQRPDILAAEQNLIAANANIGVAKANFFPQISLTGAFGTESSQLSNLLTSSSNVWQYGLTLLQEVFTGGRLTSALKLARAQKETLLHQYESTILTALQEVNDALISHRIVLNQVEVLKQRVITTGEYLRLSNLRYQDGLTDYLTFLDAERQFFSVQLEYVQALADSFTTLIDIYKSLGGGWVAEADQVVE